MTIRNRFIFMPLCLCLFFVSSFSSGGTGSKELSIYLGSVRDTILVKSADSLNKYKGKSCIVGFHISRDGSFSFNTISGSPDLCNQVSDVLGSIKKFPPPPSEDIYLRIKDGKLDFKF